MGFGNGYDSGYSDAIEDVRNGKVAGLGPASKNKEAVPATRTAGLFCITGGDETLGIDFSQPAVLSGGDVPASELPATFTSAGGSPLAHVVAPSGGWVPGDAIMFCHNNDALVGIDRGDSAPDDNACSNVNVQSTDMMFMRLADAWTLFPISSFG